MHGPEYKVLATVRLQYLNPLKKLEPLCKLRINFLHSLFIFFLQGLPLWSADRCCVQSVVLCVHCCLFKGELRQFFTQNFMPVKFLCLLSLPAYSSLVPLTPFLIAKSKKATLQKIRFLQCFVSYNVIPKKREICCEHEYILSLLDTKGFQEAKSPLGPKKAHQKSKKMFFRNLL